MLKCQALRALLVIALFYPASLAYSDNSESEQVEETTDRPAEMEKEPNESEQPEERGFLNYHRAIVIDRVVDLAATIDGFLAAKDDVNAKHNESYVVLNLETRFREEGAHEYSTRLKGKVDLPNAKKRWKLIFESQPDEDFSPSETERQGNIRSRDVASERSIAGLEYSVERDVFEWRPSIDIGSRFDFPLDLFTRVKLQKYTRLREEVVMYNLFELPYFAREGAKPALRWGVRFREGKRISFRSHFRYKYTRQERLHELSQSFRLNQVVNDHMALSYQIGVYGDNEPISQTDGYYVQFFWKNLIYDDWIYLTLAPEVDFTRDRDWEPFFSFSFQIQAIYLK